MSNAVSPLVWVITVVALLAIVALDLVVIARRRRTVTVRQATRWVSFYVGLAAVFAGGLFALAPSWAGGQFVAGYITEYSLSVDNLFVFVIIMAKFGVPSLAEDMVLYIGIVASLMLRAVFIAVGVAAITAASWVFYIFGGFLVYTAAKLAVEGDTDEPDFNESRIVSSLRRILPSTPDYAGSSLTTRVEGRRVLTPLVFAIATIAVANVAFALDSIPAIFGLTQDAYIIITANAFALMGLRQLYFLLGGLLERLAFLNIGLSAILAFIGVKLVIEALHGSHVESLGPVPLPEIGTAASLGVIVGALAVTGVASLLKDRLDRRRPTEVAAAGPDAETGAASPEESRSGAVTGEVAPPGNP
jgi:tellurite resistance protein TerC